MSDHNEDQPRLDTLFQDEDQPRDQPRQRKLNPKGLELYQSQRKKHTNKLKTLWQYIVSLLQDIKSTPPENESLVTPQERIFTSVEKYRRQSKDYIEFPVSQRSEESSQDLEIFKQIFDMRTDQTDLSLNALQIVFSSLWKAESMITGQCSGKHKNSGSQGSSTSANATKLKRADAEALKTRLAFAHKENFLTKQETELNQNKIKEAAIQKAEMERKVLQ